MDAFSHISGAAHDGAFGLNGMPQPSLAQVRSGDYQKGQAELHGLAISIETPQGTRRTGKSDGAPWSVICQAHYGYINGARGADGDELDVFIGPWPESQMVYAVNRVDKSGKFDEHKLLLAFPTQASAVAAYRNSYEAGSDGLQSVVPMSINQLKWWIENGDHAVPIESTQLPYDGKTIMNEISWDTSGNPVGTTVPALIYALRGDDGDGLLLDSVSTADVMEASDGEIVLDGLVLPYNQLNRKLGQMQVIMRAAGTEVKPVAMQITPPFKQRGTTNVAGIFEMSDGQTITVFFHNPDSTPNKLTPTDEMVSWKWMLNKKDVTIVVAREQGRELNPREVARRVMRLVEANSARFVRANARRAERLAGIEQARATIEQKQELLGSLNAEIERLEPLVAAKAAEPVAQLQGDDHVNRDNGLGLAGEASAFERSDSPGILEVATAMQTAGNGSAWWNDAGVNYVINKAKERGWVNRPSTSQVQWTQAGVDALSLARAKSAVVQRPEDAGELPPGWTESQPGGMATSRDPRSGGIIDKALVTGKWFVVFEDESIPPMDGTFDTRAQAIAAHQAVLAARAAAEAAASEAEAAAAAAQPSGDTLRALELIRAAAGDVAMLGGSSFFTFDVDGDDAVFTDEMRAEVEKLLGEKVKEVTLPGLEGQVSIVPASFQVPSANAIPDGVLSALEAAGWSRSSGSAIATKSFKSLDITKDALAFLTAGDGYNRTLQFEFTSEGRNIVESSSVLIPVTSNSDQAQALAAAGIAAAEKKIGGSYGSRLATDDPLAGARAYLGTVIDGSIDLADPAVADRLTELYEAHNGNAEFDELFGKAADAYQAFMVALAQGAI